VLAGPHTFNFKAAYAAIFSAQGFGRVTTSADIRDAAGALLDDPEGAEAFGKAAAVGAEKLSGAVAATASFVAKLLPEGGAANAGA
jgi:3-deoxy-D-manno-octulosonic-acid transferase